MVHLAFGRASKQFQQFHLNHTLIYTNCANFPTDINFVIMKSLDPLRAKKTFIRKKLGHTAVSAI